MDGIGRLFGKDSEFCKWNVVLGLILLSLISPG